MDKDFKISFLKVVDSLLYGRVQGDKCGSSRSLGAGGGSEEVWFITLLRLALSSSWGTKEKRSWTTDKPLLREGLWTSGVMKTERRWWEGHQQATVGVHVHIRQTFSSSGQSHTTSREDTTAGRAFPVQPDLRTLGHEKWMLVNRQHIPSQHYIITTSSVVKDNSHSLLYYFLRWAGLSAQGFTRLLQIISRLGSHAECKVHSSCCSKPPSPPLKTSKKKLCSKFLSFKSSTLSSWFSSQTLKALGLGLAHPDISPF